jgi:phage terminase Nu1 subunit (DNA packaging protein)
LPVPIDIDDDGTVDAETLAICLNGLSVRRIGQLAKGGHVVRVKRGRYALAESMSAYVRFVSKPTGADGAPDHTAEVARQRAEKLAMENAKARGELIPVADMSLAMQTAFAYVRSQILALPTKAAPEVFTLETVGEVKERLSELVSDVLTEISETRAVQISTDGDGNGASGRSGKRGAKGATTAAKSKRKRVGRPRKNTKRGK